MQRMSVDLPDPDGSVDDDTLAPFDSDRDVTQVKSPEPLVDVSHVDVKHHFNLVALRSRP
jgi:hypothetical protein